jgi:hypothetical protein
MLQVSSAKGRNKLDLLNTWEFMELLGRGYGLNIQRPKPFDTFSNGVEPREIAAASSRRVRRKEFHFAFDLTKLCNEAFSVGSINAPYHLNDMISTHGLRQGPFIHSDDVDNNTPARYQTLHQITPHSARGLIVEIKNVTRRSHRTWRLGLGN